MQSAKERDQLQERYGVDEPRPFIAVLKCLAGLVALCAVAAAPWLVAGSGGAVAVEIPPIPSAAAALPNSMAESKRIFDERRSRYEARSQSTQGAALAQELDTSTSPGGEGRARPGLPVH